MKRILPLIAGLAVALFTAGAAAQADYPAKPVTLVTAFPAGSGPDAVLRLVADKLGRIWNQRVVVDNRPGGGGFIAIDQARRAAPDGYTLLQLDSEHIAALPHLYKSRNFVTLQHFDPVASLFRTPFFVAVPTDSKWKNMSDLIAAAKAGPVSYGSWGVGSPGHLGAQQLEALAGVQMQHVPYREVSQLYTNVGSGEVAWSFASIPSSQGVYKAGKLRYIAVATARRVPQMPDVPTMAESGGPPGLEVTSFVSLLAPKGVSPAIQSKINADVAKVIADPDIRARFDTFAFEPLAWSPDEIRRQAEAKSKVYGELVRRGNISLE
ncbi:tripartite tricarboxylate transporter substrate binding protein [Variovorax soli]|uniref:Tripartite-type tricarboxylate transporter receptor subunit TctC n=1 Tax=Variovorax soli TaxID=376815 RepID=A0ABU1NAB9_9BURK|nr:tripartite tricarboxylate transporter substrate binding protein [Variovorax soli]MDR6534856.1 tripartite-type tricarboxylate transporter receptor subunit TctC [Variovorax soli]